MLDCYNSNLTYYFEKILKEKEFILEDFNENINKVITNDSFIENTIYDENNHKEIIKFLKLPNDDDILNKYTNIIYDNSAFKKHLYIILFLTSNDYLTKKFNNSYTIKLLKTIKNKIIICRSLMDKLNIPYFDFKNLWFADESFEFETDEWKNLQTIFNLQRKKPTNKQDLLKLIVSLIRNITCNDIIINSNREQKKYKQFYKYSINYDLINFHLNLYNFRINSHIVFHDQIYNNKTYNITRYIVNNLNLDCFLD